MKKPKMTSALSVFALNVLFISFFVSMGNAFTASFHKPEDPDIHKQDDSTTVISQEKIRQENTRLATDLKKLKTFSDELASMRSEMYEMRERSNVGALDYFPPEEHDDIESILFRYLMIRNSLWEMVNYYDNYRERFTTPETRTKAFLTGYSAGLHLTSNTSLLVDTFIDEPVGKDKLNEAYPRSDIPSGTYDMLLSSVTSLDHMEAIKVARVLFIKEATDSDSILYRVYHSDPEYQSVIDQVDGLYNQTEERISHILKMESLLFPETVNRLKQTVIIKAADKLSDKIGDNLYAIRGLLFSNVSDIKIPLTRPLHFSQAQKNKIHAMLEPGDIILTYTAGYMSNIFLPGAFKHGITYVGTGPKRKETGLADDPTELVKGIEIEKLEAAFRNDTTDSGLPADVIEAVAEGVIFNSLDHLLDTHINRMVILRPKLTPKEKREALTIVFALLGTGYDFKFDFNDGSYQCCTEVIYRSLNSRGGFNFDLTRRVGAHTLSADDILEYYAGRKYKPFDLVLYAGETGLSDDKNAKLFPGNAGLKQLKKILKTR
jgi:hypothetical protein